MYVYECNVTFSHDTNAGTIAQIASLAQGSGEVLDTLIEEGSITLKCEFRADDGWDLAMILRDFSDEVSSYGVYLDDFSKAYVTFEDES